MRPFVRIPPPKPLKSPNRGFNWTLPVFALLAVAYSFVNPRLDPPPTLPEERMAAPVAPPARTPAGEPVS